MELKEKDILKAVKDLLKIEGFFVIRNHQSLGSHPGLSDLTAIKKGKVFFIEIKTSRGFQSNDQINFQKNVESHGGVYLLIRSVDSLFETLKEMDLCAGRLF
jgi:Holliday junction resolvase